MISYRKDRNRDVGERGILTFHRTALDNSW